MKQIYNKNKKAFYLIVISIFIILAMIISTTYSYFQAQGNTSSSTDVDITSETTDNLTFDTGEKLTINANQDNFAKTKGSLSSSTTATATLKARSDKASTYKYDLSLNISSNEFTYTQDTSTPELILQVTGPDGEITSIDGLTYTSVTDIEGKTIKGFDITTLIGSTYLVLGDEITASAGETTTEEYTITVVFVNLNADQEKNTGKTFKANVVIGKQTLAGYISLLAKTDTTNLATDDPDGNVRYIGGSPSNYVTFNDETWRIIGVFDVKTSEDATTTEKRVKLIRSESIGEYSWDYKQSGVGSSTSSYGSSDWTDSQLMMYLNSSTGYALKTGYTKTNGVVSDASDNVFYEDYKIPVSTAAGLTSYGGEAGTFKLTSEAQSMIDDAVWGLGRSETGDPGTPETAYKWERGNLSYSSFPTRWAGQIGLLYPSDYGYATAGDTTIDRNTCLSYNMRNWGSYESCYLNDWLYFEKAQWTISSSTLYGTVYWMSSGVWGFTGSSTLYKTSTLNVQPTVYLTSNVTTSSGDGTIGNPYILALG